MAQIVEIAWDSLCKHSEELCGDWVKIVTTPDDLVVALSDGLGSGVKANILATLTTEIAADMLERGASIDEVVETLVDTLPECQMRHLAYATFAVLRIHHAREVYLAEYDSPPLILVRRGEVVELPLQERMIADRKIREGRFTIELGDYLVMLSDGYLHAGVGGLYRMGWGWQNIATAVKRWAATAGECSQLAAALRHTCLKLANNHPGDDATTVVMRVRPERRATVMTGPPADAARDGEAVARLLNAEGVKVICGGTTAQMTARVLGKPLRVEWRPQRTGSAPGPGAKSLSENPIARPELVEGRPLRQAQDACNGNFRIGPKLPPAGQLEGVDLITEGILTLSAAVDRLRDVSVASKLPSDQDAATRLARILLNADQIHFLVGDAINPQQLADVVRGVPMRQIYLNELIARLGELNKLVTVEHL